MLFCIQSSNRFCEIRWLELLYYPKKVLIKFFALVVMIWKNVQNVYSKEKNLYMLVENGFSNWIQVLELCKV